MYLDGPGCTKAYGQPIEEQFEFPSGEENADGSLEMLPAVTVCVVPWDQAAPDDVVYVPDSPDDATDFYTRRYFEEMVHRFVTNHHLPEVDADGRSYAWRLWNLCSWQHPSTLLAEELGDHCLWDDAWDQPGVVQEQVEGEVL